MHIDSVYLKLRGMKTKKEVLNFIKKLKEQNVHPGFIDLAMNFYMRLPSGTEEK